MPPRLLSLTLVATVAACATPAVERPRVETPARFSNTGAAPLPDRWWQSFGDPILDRLIDTALADNPGLLATWQRLSQAEASARRAGASSLPTVTADASGGESVRGSSGSADASSSISLGLAASYEIDLWGGIGAAKDAAAYDAAATARSLSTAAITLSAQIATTWYGLVGERRQNALLSDQLATAHKTLAMVELRYAAGAIPETDVLRQRQEVESIRGEQALAAGRIRVLENGLVILMGKPPGTALPDAVDAPSLPPMPATGVPAELLQRRPDIAESYLRILAADRRVAEAIADRFPRLSLSLRASTAATTPQGLFSDWLASIVGNLVQPLVDGGARKAELDRARAALLERIHLYRGAVLDAMGEVEDALVRETRQVEFLRSLDEQIALARRTYELTQASYRAGAADYLRVLDAESSLRSLERRRVTGEHDAIAFRIALCRALAGGWDMSRPGA